MRTTFTSLIADFATMSAEMEVAIKEALTKSAVEVHKTAVEKFGKYQGAHGPYEAWKVLAPSTLKQKFKAGAGSDDPLIGHYSGNRHSKSPVPLRQSITMEIGTLSAKVGTNDPVGKYQEYGTSRGIPPRPFLRPALYQNQDFIKQTMSEAIGMGLVRWFH